jgi:hypothetical protein
MGGSHESIRGRQTIPEPALSQQAASVPSSNVATSEGPVGPAAIKDMVGTKPGARYRAESGAAMNQDLMG